VDLVDKSMADDQLGGEQRTQNRGELHGCVDSRAMAKRSRARSEAAI
jgi:hypothetical protein